jgi:hypothetical protein
MIAAALLVGCLPLWMGTTCSREQTPEAITYNTLEQAQVFAKAYVDLFDAKVLEGGVPVAKQIEVNRAYVRVLEGINAAAAAARDGFSTQTPEEVQRLIQNLVNILVVIVPPPTN